MIDETERQRILDEEHLRLLSIGYYVSGGTTAFITMFFGIYVLMGLVLAFSGSSFPGSSRGGPGPEVVGWILAGFGCALMFGFGLLAAAKIWAGRCLAKRQSRTLCLIVAGFSCLEMPYGTVLGIFTFTVLQRPSVMARFGGAA